MSRELDAFEQTMHQEIDNFLKAEPGSAKRPARPEPAAEKSTARPSASEVRTGHIVKLAVRTKQLEMDTAFEHRSSSISKLEAQLEAEKAARQAGYPIIGHVIDIQRL
ncbi:hypothetical protein [Halomonas koreensis]|uniref:Uncharacterized protein n=1 Tax=Halomonas koreensis TaxID=245385 RepID=A0ABU1G121_9GAMM|nr:hypothetical protein [Halomonas koreensis]MDR5866134.1 hypothetical protein [Halomonas koreensis]